MTSISNIIIIILHNLRCIRKHYERVYCTGLIFMKTSFNVISILNPFIVSLRLASQHFCFAAPICYNNNNISAFVSFVCFFFQAEDGIRDHCVTGVQTCALPICPFHVAAAPPLFILPISRCGSAPALYTDQFSLWQRPAFYTAHFSLQIGRASCRERV